MTHLRFFRGIVLAASVLFASPPARSDPARAEPASHEASRRFDQGVRLAEDGDWRAALIEFERAYAITPNFRVLYDIGQCKYQLQEYAGALSAFQSYLADGGQEVPAERRKVVQANLDELRDRVARVRVSTNVSGAEVAVDDVVVGTTPLSSELLVAVGRRRISASKPGMTSSARVVDVAGRDGIDVRLDLTAVVIPLVVPPKETSLVAAEGRARAPRRMAPVWIAFGVGVAGAAVGTYFGLAAIGNKHDLDRQCPDKQCPLQSQSLIDESRRNAILSTSGVAAAIVGVGTGLGFFLLGRGAEGSRTGLASNRLQIVVGAASLSARGSF